MAEPEISKAAGRIAFTYPSLVLFQLARFFLVLATEMQAVAVGWQVYEITKRPLDLGLVGLAQFLPGIFLFLVSGHAADRYPRRNLLVLCYCGFTLCSGSLLFLTLRGLHSVYPIFVVTVLLGVVRSFNGPVSRRSEEHTSELQSQSNLVCRLLLEKKKKKYIDTLLF